MATVIDGKKGTEETGVPPHLVILPESYNGKRMFPAVYLLHGLFGSRFNWTELTHATKNADAADLVIIAPEGNNSWYVGETERSLITELIPHIETEFRVNTNRENRAIAGISMGGYGALNIAFRNPDSFSFAASMSGAFEAPRQTESEPGIDWEIMRDSLNSAFLSGGNDFRAENDIFELIKRPIVRKPKVYFNCGLSDQFLEANRTLERSFKDNGIEAEYREFPGGHDWEYWDEQLPVIIQKAASHFKAV